MAVHVQVVIKLNNSGVRDYLRASRDDPAMINALREPAREMARLAGHGFEAKQMMRRVNRPGFIVYPRYPAAKEVQLRERRLEKAVVKMSRRRSVVAKWLT